MGNYLLHHAWVQFYLVAVGALATAVIWERLRRPPVSEDDRGPCRDGGVGREARPPAESKKPFRPVSGPGR
jgi:hypothetical protein